MSYSVMRPGLPEGSFVRVADGTYVASPELCYVQMADRLTSLELSKWGMEICGSYRIGADGALAQRGFALTDVQRLWAFMNGYGCRRGAGRAKESARWLMNGSASPRETMLALHFRIPRRCGGNGVGEPALNYRVQLSAEMKGIAGKRYYVADEYWPKGNLAVEYESDAVHSETQKVHLDMRRRNLLQFMGIRVITVTTSQLNSLMEIDNIAAQIARGIGLRQERLSDEYARKHSEFHRQLLHVDQRYRL